jgi:hypothetical protein
VGAAQVVGNTALAATACVMSLIGLGRDNLGAAPLLLAAALDSGWSSREERLLEAP